MASKLTISVLLCGSAVICASLAAAADESASAGKNDVFDWHYEFNLGNQRLTLQDLPGAESCFKQALQDLRKTRSSGADDRAGCMQALAGVMVTQGKFEEPTSLYKKSLRLLQRQHGTNGIEILPPLLALGDIYRNDGEYSRAGKYYERASAIIAATSGVESVAYADCQHRIGMLSMCQNLYRKAEECYRTSLKILMHQSNLSSGALLADVLNDYIDLYGKMPEQGKTLSSDFQSQLLKDNPASFQRTKAVSASLWSRQMAQRAATNTEGAATFERTPANKPTEEQRIFPNGLLNGSNSIAVDRKLPDFAALESINKQRVDFYERMIAVDINSLGERHPSVARDLTGLAYIYLTQKQYDKAKPLLARALKIYQNNYGNDSDLVERTQTLISSIADEQNASGSVDYQAMTQYLSALPAIPLPAKTIEISSRLNYLSFLAYCHGRVQDADKFYAWALASTSAACGEQSPVVASTLQDYARVLRSAGKPTDAEKMENSAYAIAKQSVAKRAAFRLP